MIKAIGIALTGLNSASQRLNASAANIANLQTVGSLEEGRQKPYTPLTTKQSTITGEGGNVHGVSTKIVPRSQPFVPAFDADSPFADENGIIGITNINLAEEIVNIKLAEITFKANIITLKAASEMSDELLRLFDKKV